MKEINNIGKIADAGSLVDGGAIDRYWNRADIQIYPDFYVGVSTLHKWNFLYSSTEALEHFNLKSVEFGNWMTQEDRANFLYASMLSLHHLTRILGVRADQIGLGGKLSMALGARGHGGTAIAHYEPNPRSIINLTKPHGKGSLAHEFAHAVDNAISYYTGKKFQTYVSGGRSTRKGYEEEIAEKGNYFEKQFEELFNILFYDEDGNKTDLHENLDRETEYINRRNEVFARTFEVYTFLKLKAKKITNHFLVDTSYKAKIYPTEALVKKVAPLIEDILEKCFELMSKKGESLKGLVIPITGYKGFRKTLIENADLNDTLENMQRIAFRDTHQVSVLAKALEGKSVAETTENIWNWLRTNTKYKLDENGLEELRTPARSIVDGKDGLTNPKNGIDCDDYTILISALLLNLGIDHEYRIVAYEDKGKFQHIYPVAFDNQGNEYVIDAVPEIPEYNYEAQPILDIKTIQINASHLNGYLPYDATINPIINPPKNGNKTDNMELHELSGINDAEEFKNDLKEELNQPFNLSGIEEDLEDEILVSSFLSGLGEVATEEEAEIVISSTDDAVQLIENGLLAEVNKARLSLIEEKRSPSELSKLINVDREIRTLDEIMEAWDDEDERETALKQAVISRSNYANFYRAILMSLQELEDAQNRELSGMSDEVIYLARMEEFDLSQLMDEDNELTVEGVGFLKKFFKKTGGFFKKVFNKVGTGVKKVVKAVVRYNPLTIAARGSIIGLLKANAFQMSSRLIYGFLTQEQAESHGLDLDEWRKIVDAKNKAESFFTKMGGRAEKFREAIVKGKAAQKTGLKLSGLGAENTKTSGFINFIKGLLSKINPLKLFKKKNKSSSTTPEQSSVSSPEAPNMSIEDFNDDNFPSVSRTSAPTTTEDPDAPKPSIFKRMFTKDFWKNEVWAKHKKKIIIAGGLITILIPLAIYLFRKYKQKKKRQLAGVKAAKTRARNRKKTTSRSSSSSKKRTSSSSKSKKKAEPVGRGSTTVIQHPTKGRGKTRVKKMTSRERLSLMHKIAKDLQKKHPKTKYATLLSRASKMI